MERKPRATANTVNPKARKTKAGTEGTKGRKPAPDWEIVEGAYRAGILSIRAIASQHGLDESAVRWKAKAEGWKRDQAAKVLKKAREELLRTSSPHSAPQSSIKEAEQQAVQTIVAVVRDHQKLLKRGHNIVEGMLAELQETAENLKDIDAVIEADKGDAKHKAMLKRAIGLPRRAGIMLNLSATLKNLVGMERQAFGIDGRPEESNPLAGIFELIDGARWNASAQA
jgi:hypothetical protein